MEPRWEVIRGAVTIFVCIVLLRVACVIWTECDKQIIAFLATMRNIGPNRTIEENNWGLAAFGLVLISLLAVVRILTGLRK
jgi:hypothetical protein